MSDKPSSQPATEQPAPNQKFVELVGSLQAKQQEEAAARAAEPWSTTLSRTANEFVNGVMNIPNLWKADPGKEDRIQACMTARTVATGFDNQRSFCDGSKQMVATGDSPVAVPVESLGKK